MTIAGDRIEHEIVIAAPPELVFACFTDAELDPRWMGRVATSTRAPAASTAASCTTPRPS